MNICSTFTLFFTNFLIIGLVIFILEDGTVSHTRTGLLQELLEECISYDLTF